MIIGGFQKFSLLEYPGKIGAVIFTQGCNFRCPYCHNPELVDPQRYSVIITEESVLNFLELRKGKLDCLTITGGEPTIQTDIIEFSLKIKSFGYSIKMDTNGSQPEIVKELIKNKAVDYWAMDIKAPLSLYSTVAGCIVKEQNIRKSMDLIRKSGAEWEFRTTYFNQLLNWNDILEIQTLLQPGDHYYLQQCNYENTLEPIENPHQTNLELLFKKDQVRKKNERSGHYTLLKDTNRLQQIIIKMR